MNAEEANEIQTTNLPWYQIWFKTYFSPKTGTYEGLIQGEPKSEMSRATVWIGVSTLITGLIPLLIYWLSGGQILHDDLFDAGLIGQGEIAIVFVFISAVIGAVIVAPVGLYLASSVLHLVAKKLGGEGFSEKIAFLLAAIASPSSLIDATVEGLLGNTVFGMGVRLTLILYQVALTFLAIKAVYKLSNGRAAGVVGFAGLLVTALASCLIGFFALAL